MPLLGLSNFSVVSDEVIFLQLNDVPRDLEGWLMLVYIFLSFLAFFFFFLNMGVGASDVTKEGMELWFD